jgi:hypothetical protein
VTTHPHDTPLKLCGTRPGFAVELAGELLGLPIPDHDEAIAYSESATDEEVRDLNADNVVVCRKDGGSLLGIIVEVQRERNNDKEFSWPAYRVNIRHRVKAPAVLIAVCPRASVAAWAARAFDTGHPGFTFRALVLGPHNYPKVTEVSGTGALAERMVLGTLIHEQADDIGLLLGAASNELSALPAPLATRYSEYMLGQLSERPRAMLEALMQNETYPYQSKLLADREARGEVRGAAETLLAVIEARGLHLTENQRRRVESCEDPGQLMAWAKRAVLAPTVTDLIG